MYGSSKCNWSRLVITRASLYHWYACTDYEDLTTCTSSGHSQVLRRSFIRKHTDWFESQWGRVDRNSYRTWSSVSPLFPICLYCIDHRLLTLFLFCRRTAREASIFVRKLQSLLRATGVSKGNMEQVWWVSHLSPSRTYPVQTSKSYVVRFLSTLGILTMRCECISQARWI